MEKLSRHFWGILLDKKQTASINHVRAELVALLQAMDNYFSG